MSLLGRSEAVAYRPEEASQPFSAVGSFRQRADLEASTPNVGGDQQLNLMDSGCNCQESAFKDFRSPCRRPPRSGLLTTIHRAFRQNPDDRGKPGVRSARKPTF